MRMFTFALLAAFTFGQAQSDTAHFEVISVKPPPPVGQAAARLGCIGNRFEFAGVPFTRLLQWVYELPPTRIQGLPTWVTDYINKTDSMYEIDARASAAVSEAQCKAMVQLLLADRFKMAARVELREMPVYTLAVAKKGPKMRKVGPDAKDAGVNFNGIPIRSILTLGDTPAGVSMAQLARRLSAVPILERPVIDRTGLTGIYSFDLNFATSASDSDERPSIWTAIEEQLGLKLQSIKAPIEVLVVDHIERPTAN